MNRLSSVHLSIFLAPLLTFDNLDYPIRPCTVGWGPAITNDFPIPEALSSLGQSIQVHPPRAGAGRSSSPAWAYASSSR
jgi:hypothetical protein